MKFLYLSALRRELNEAAQKRLDAFEDGEDNYEAPKDHNGNSLEFYIENNLKAPDYLKEASKNSEYIQFDLDEDYDVYQVDVIVKLDQFSMAIDDAEGGCVVYLQNATNVQVLETAEEVEFQARYHSRSNWQVIIDYIKTEYKRIRNKFNKNRKVK